MKADMYILRQHLVAYARKHGIRAAALEFGCSRNTVRKWIRRTEEKGRAGLNEESRRPHSCPHQVPENEEEAIIKLRLQTGAGAARLRYEWGVKRSEGAIKRILREHGLMKKRKRKHKTKKRLAKVKRKWKLFGQLCMDTKYLTDIPFYWPQMQCLKLPRYQYTVREVVSGLCFTGYADEISKTYASLMASSVCAHLADCGLDLETVEWQTDNGSEFLVNSDNQGMPADVKDLGCRHHFIPPKAYTWQSDVETVHSLQENEFFDRISFSSKNDFWRKISLYWLYFNIARPNRNKQFKTPLQIIRERNPRLSPKIASWFPLDLNDTLHLYLSRFFFKVGHHLPAPPSMKSRNRSGGTWEPLCRMGDMSLIMFTISRPGCPPKILSPCTIRFMNMAFTRMQCEPCFGRYAG